MGLKCAAHPVAAYEVSFSHQIPGKISGTFLTAIMNVGMARGIRAA